jgi:RNA polymerase sigma-70 factor (ECF subfamily)
MNEVNIAAEKSETREESQLSYSIRNRVDAPHDFSAKRDRHKNGIINHERLCDEKLVRSFLETQDEEAFNEIVNRYADKIYRLALRITRNPNDAEEVLQEVFLTLIEKLNTFRGGSKFSTWLYRVAANESYIQFRSEKKYGGNTSLEDYVSYDEDGALRGVRMKDWSDRPDELFLSKEGMEKIETAVNGLPVAYRIVFHLRDVEGLTTQEVANVLGLSITAVKSRVRRARLFLRDKLSDYFFDWKE